MAGGTVSRTAHFALHRLALDASSTAMASQAAAVAPTGPGSLPHTQGPQALFVVPGVWLGAMVPKRWARRAVTRNTIKRQIYAVSSDYEDALLCASYVVRLRSGFDRKQFVSATSDQLKAAVRKELQQLFATGARRLTQARQAAEAEVDLKKISPQAIDGKAQEATDSIASQPENQP